MSPAMDGSLNILFIILIPIFLAVAVVPLWRTVAAVREGDFSCSRNIAKEWYWHVVLILAPLVMAFFLLRAAVETVCDMRYYVSEGVQTTGVVQKCRRVQDCGSADSPGGLSISTNGEISYRTKEQKFHFDLVAVYPLPGGSSGQVAFSRGDAYAPGARVTVYYRADNPQDALVYDASNGPGAAALYGCIGLAMVSLSLTFGLLVLMQRRRRR